MNDVKQAGAGRIAISENQGIKILDQEIKNCPFCGYGLGLIGVRVMRFEEGFHAQYAVKCLNCNTYGPDARSADAAITFWNMRLQGMITKEMKEDEGEKKEQSQEPQKRS